MGLTIRPAVVMQVQQLSFRALLVLLGAAAMWLPFGLYANPQVQSGKNSEPVQIARSAKSTLPAIPKIPSRSTYEPQRGVYLGVALDMSQLTQNTPGPQTVRKATDLMSAWEKQTVREHAIYTGFFGFPHADGSFSTWDRDPQGWITAADFSGSAASLGAAPLLTLEPFQPHGFSRDWKPGNPSYDATKAFAQGAGRWGKPLFIRFAHEMNGHWYPWAEWIDQNRNLKRDPGEDTGFTSADYRVAYRNVAAMFRLYAPNTALVWCPNSGLIGGARRDVFSPWYPGDDVVDWVALDIYERGWTMPMPGAHLWAGQFANNLTSDMADDPNTSKNESVNFYQTYAVGKNKPLMIGETSSTVSFRTDLPRGERATLNHAWKTGYWNDQEYGWLQGVYGTSAYSRRNQRLSRPIDSQFPRLKAIVWFQIGKRETTPVEKKIAGKSEIIWFDNTWTDYRIGGGVDENELLSTSVARKELELYRRLTDGEYFLGNIKR